jgi:hypothetical protein
MWHDRLKAGHQTAEWATVHQIMTNHSKVPGPTRKPLLPHTRPPWTLRWQEDICFPLT